MKQFIHELINELDHKNEFTTEQAVIYTTLAIAVFVVALCGESVILSMF